MFMKESRKWFYKEREWVEKKKKAQMMMMKMDRRMKVLNLKKQTFFFEWREEPRVLLEALPCFKGTIRVESDGRVAMDRNGGDQSGMEWNMESN